MYTEFIQQLTIGLIISKSKIYLQVLTKGILSNCCVPKHKWCIKKYLEVCRGSKRNRIIQLKEGFRKPGGIRRGFEQGRCSYI
jgi:hypothetical protein